MKTIKDKIIFEQEINKSKFITYLYPCDDVKQAKIYLQEVKKIHPQATHHVSVYIIGKTGEYGQANDDKEPSNTAAKPIMDVFRKNDITNFICIVVRYFGGIKLGAGGLIRAYSSSASLALNEACIIDIIEYEELFIEYNYTFDGIINNIIKDYVIINKNYTTNIQTTIKLPKNEINKLKEKLIAITNNHIIFK